MMIRKCKLLKFLFVFLFMFIFITGVNATTGTLEKSTKRYLYKDGTITEVDEAQSNAFFYKFSSNGSYICYTGLNIPSVTNGSCPASTLNETESIALAYIINSVTGTNGGITNMSSQIAKYYWTEIAVLKYLNHTDGLTLSDSVINTQIQNISSTKENMTSLKSSASSYAKKYSNPINLGLTESKLEFELVGDYYYSQKVYIKDTNSNIDSTNISVDNNNFLVEEGTDNKGKYFKIKISKSNISGKSSKVNVNVSASNKYYMAKFYNCSDEYQDLLATSTLLKTSSGSTKISGELSVTKLVIDKVDEKGNYLSGAKIKIESTDGKYQNVVLTQDKSIVLENLPYGKYTITEISAPNNYVTSKDVTNIELSENKLSEQVKLVNNLTRVEVSKIDGKTGKLLEGCKLQVQDKEGNVLYEWESTNEKYIIEGLSYGNYYIAELSAPDGYDLIKEKVEFKVDDSIEVVSVKVANNQNVDVPDTFSTTSSFLLFMAMIFIFIGLSVILFVRKKINN